MIVVPYPHAAAHQEANAAEMVEAGAALLVADEDLDGDTLREAGDLLFDERLAMMSAAALGVGRPGAAVAGARLLEVLAAHEALPSQAELDEMTRGVTRP
jgi:UDP-N-acetylglucosamine--N-acetylmuramyl-(pentapeptide) pyrophosphoryl-undecaprenol N-acetylglucosamine transferase